MKKPCVGLLRTDLAAVVAFMLGEFQGVAIGVEPRIPLR
jgi:hypothetical protein